MWQLHKYGGGETLKIGNKNLANFSYPLTKSKFWDIRIGGNIFICDKFETSVNKDIVRKYIEDIIKEQCYNTISSIEKLQTERSSK